jgi:hypothetical protein
MSGPSIGRLAALGMVGLAQHRSTDGVKMADDPLKPSEWEKLIQYGTKLIGLDEASPYFGKPLGFLILLATVLAILFAITLAIAKIKELWDEKLRPLKYSPEEKRRASRRRQFANYVLREINLRNLTENWRDEEFTDLEAEVEAEGRRRRFFFAIPIFSLSTLHLSTGIRREPSLTKALERSTERLILLEGDPGSGKSVALRHVAQVIASRASAARRSDSLIPIFVNLKELKRECTEQIDSKLIRTFILRSLNRVNDRFVDEFIQDEFDRGTQNGSWVFLFDSFDEIPDVLSSTDADDAIQRYSDAISNFLSGFNSCRGVVASRFYRGPSQKGWRKFGIVELSQARQEQLVARALLTPAVLDDLKRQLSIAADDIQSMAKNPMLLGLLCEHVRLGNEFPILAHEVFEKYFDFRFSRDADRVLRRYELDAIYLRQAAEKIAFIIAKESTLGLSPPRATLIIALRKLDHLTSETQLKNVLDALEFMKIARGSRDGAPTVEGEFTFAHRRFQEYFATCVVIRNSQLISPRHLLLDARWRETAVVLCQTGRDEDVAPLVSEAGIIVNIAYDAISSRKDPGTGEKLRFFDWPPNILHVLGILQAGFGNSKRQIPSTLREVAAKILLTATETGSLLDRKFALEVAGVAPEETIVELIRQALLLQSQWMNDVVFRQVSRLSVIPADLLEWVRIAILRVALGFGARRKRDALHAHVSRLYNSKALRDAIQLAYSIRPLDALGICVATFLFGSVAVGDVMNIRDIWKSTPAFVVMPLTLNFAYWPHVFDARFGAIARMIRVEAIILFCCIIAFPQLFATAMSSGAQFDFTFVEASTRFCIVGGLVYLLTWPHAMVASIKQASFPSVVLCPFIQLFVINVRIFSRIRESIFAGVTKFVSNPYPFVLALLVLLGFPAGAAMLYLIERPNHIRLFVLAYFGILALPYAIGLVVSAVLHWRDFWSLRLLRSSRPHDLEPAELAHLFEGFKTDYFRYQLLNFVRTRGLLRRLGDYSCIWRVAEELEGKDYVPLRIRQLARWPRILKSAIRGMLSLHPSFRAECRDEIYMLLERRIESEASSQKAN